MSEQCLGLDSMPAKAARLRWLPPCIAMHSARVAGWDDSASNLHPAQLASYAFHTSPRSTIGTQSGDDAGGRWLLLPPGWAGPTYGFPPSRVAESPTRQVGCPLLGRPGGCDVRVQQGCIIGS